MKLRKHAILLPLVLSLSAGAAFAEDAKPAPAKQETPAEAAMRMHLGTWDVETGSASSETDFAKLDKVGGHLVMTSTKRSDSWVLDQINAIGSPYAGTGVWGPGDAASGCQLVGVWMDNSAKGKVRHDCGHYDPVRHEVDWKTENLRYPQNSTRIVEHLISADKRTLEVRIICPKDRVERILFRMVFTRHKA